MQHSKFVTIMPTGRHRAAQPYVRIVAIATAAVALLSSQTLYALTHSEGFGLEHNGNPRNYDKRLLYAPPPEPSQKARFNEQQTALAGLRQEAPEQLAVTFDPNTGVTRSLYNATGYLTQKADDSPLEIAQSWVRKNFTALGLVESDIAEYEITDSVLSQVSGASHIYLRQLYNELPVYNAQMQININRSGRLISVNNAFMRSLTTAVRTPGITMDADQAVLFAAGHLGLSRNDPPQVVKTFNTVNQRTVLDHKGISQEPIEASLMWLPVSEDEVRLVWNFQIWTLDSQHLFDMTIDAETGTVWTRFDQAAGASYRIYEQPVESPAHTSPQPPSDARAVIINPEDSTASPSGWFDTGTTIMDGNNVHACLDVDANNACDNGEPSCSGSFCDFPIYLSSPPSSSRSAAVANLFYWNNTIHDIQYQYGFDEAAGNFQEDNYNRGGFGSDSVNAEGQDGSGLCNANFATPFDGFNPRMQMYTCNLSSPWRDGDFDNGVIVHEYGHGISSRQIGGPGTTSCLGNLQQAGEGWSDVLALMYTAEVGDGGSQQRGIGSYLFALATDGTIRQQPYSTATSINNYTYESISGAGIPHGVGSVWAQAAWDVYWALVNKHGFEADLLNFVINDPYEAGNKRAMFYINEGLKNTACSPTFVDNRDGIIQAAMDNFDGEDVCLIWKAFADFGLGIDAISGGSNSTNPTNGFDMPAECNNSEFPVRLIIQASWDYMAL